MATATAPPAAAELVPHRFTVGDYYRMLEAGILQEDDRVELLGGQVVEMSPMGPPHAAAAEQARDVLQAALGTRAQVRDSKPVDLGEYDEPLPDLAAVRPRADRYATAHPTAADVFWLVEVAESSLVRDQRTKPAIYAAAGVREVWVVNLPERVLEVYRAPGPEGYLDRQTHGREAQVAPLAFPELRLAVADLVPPGGPERERAPGAKAPREHERGRGPELER
jgi:Uma2 family endonuclease